MLQKISNGKIILSIIFCLIFVGSSSAQEEQDDDPPTRSIISKDFKSKRKSSGKRPVRKRKKRVTTNSNRRYKHRRRTKYRRKQNKPVVAKVTPKYINEELGVTFWRLRPLTKDEIDDDDVSIIQVKIDQEKETVENWTAERVGSGTEFKPGDRVRFTIESSRTGFMYIVNREFYSDGTFGQPSLIFPTLRIRGGNNSVQAGSLIEIPDSSKLFPYFNITPRRDNYAGEELIVIITSEPIPGIEPELRAQKITPQRVIDWLEEWGSTIDIFDAEDGDGIAYTVEEAEAANSPTRDLTQEEPLPQTIYRVKVRKDMPLIVPLQMQAISP